MQYAAIGGLGSLLFVLTLRANSRVTDKWSSAMAVLLLDFKPHIYWFSTFLLRGKKRILMFLSLALTTYVLIYFLRNDMSFVNWIRTISERKNGLTSDPTLISPAFVLFHNFVPMYVLLAIHVLTVLSILTMCKKYSLNLEATAIATYAGALATTPYLHTIDTLGVALLALVNILRREKINIVNLLLVFANCLWSTSAVFSVAFIVLVILVLHISNKLSNTKLSVLVGAIWAILLHLITQILEINQIPSWYYSLVLVLNIYAIFNMRSAQNA
jgi:hypothetical protein